MARKTVTRRWIAGRTVHGKSEVHEVEGCETPERFYVDDGSFQKSQTLLDYRRVMRRDHLFETREAAIGDVCDRLLREIELRKEVIAKLDKHFWEMKALLDS